MPVNDHKPAFYGSIATDTGISAPAGYSSNTTANTISSLTPISSSAINGPYVISPSGGGILGGTTNYNYQTPDWQNKRMDVRDNGKIPVDIWALMYNNGVIDD